MRCINKCLTVCLLVLFSVILLTGCGKPAYDIPYDVNSKITAYRLESDSSSVLEPFAKNLCVADEDISNSAVNLSTNSTGFVFNRSTGNTLYSKSANLSVHPASTTKIMTALLAIKYGRMDDILTATSNVEIKESGAQLCGFKEGDKATLEQVLYSLLVYSGNDAAVMIAEYISGSEAAFATLMNEEARKLGATNTHFNNSHGLTEDEHLTTAYDLYLIFNEALKYDKFKEIIQAKTYLSSYANKDGGTKKLDFQSTNRYLNGKVKVPSGVTVIGGKTGTTKAAGACLILYSINNDSGDEYITCVMNSDTADTLYENMDSLLLIEN